MRAIGGGSGARWIAPVRTMNGERALVPGSARLIPSRRSRPPADRGDVIPGDQDSQMSETMRMRQSLDQFETAFEQEAALERRRRKQLRQRAAARSRARRIQRTEQ